MSGMNIDVVKSSKITAPRDMTLRKRVWRDEFEAAAGVLGSPPEWSDKDYECFRWQSGDGTARLIFYPHRTSAGNYHVRVRDGGSANAEKAKELMRALSASSGSCTFTHTR